MGLPELLWTSEKRIERNALPPRKHHVRKYIKKEMEHDKREEACVVCHVAMDEDVFALVDTLDMQEVTLRAEAAVWMQNIKVLHKIDFYYFKILTFYPHLLTVKRGRKRDLPL